MSHYVVLKANDRNHYSAIHPMKYKTVKEAENAARKFSKLYGADYLIFSSIMRVEATGEPTVKPENAKLALSKALGVAKQENASVGLTP